MGWVFIRFFGETKWEDERPHERPQDPTARPKENPLRPLVWVPQSEVRYSKASDCQGWHPSCFVRSMQHIMTWCDIERMNDSQDKSGSWYDGYMVDIHVGIIHSCFFFFYKLLFPQLSSSQLFFPLEFFTAKSWREIWLADNFAESKGTQPPNVTVETPKTSPALLEGYKTTMKNKHRRWYLEIWMLVSNHSLKACGKC